MPRFIPLFEAHAAEWDAEFRRVGDTFPGRLQCQRGCSMCCSQMFSISFLEAEAIREAVGAMSPAERARIVAAADEYIAGAAVLGVLHESDGEASISPRPGLRLPCPALRDDACSIYAARPIICRKWGIPVFDPSKPDRLHACELNFRAGESVAAGPIVDRQSALLARWAELKEHAAEELRPSRRRWTIAEAIRSAADGV